MPSLALAMIICNAERTLSQCLDSVQGLVQEVQIIDTGSQDQSLPLAKQLGLEITSFTWCDDFSAARNASIQGLQSDWILILDADEYLSPSSQEYLPRLLQKLSRSQDPLIINGSQQTPAQPNLSKRCLFRNHKGLKFVGRVHEQLKGPGPAYTLEAPELIIAHQPENNPDKPRSYLHLIDLELSEITNPSRRAELYYHQAQSLLTLGKPVAAIAALKQSQQHLLTTPQNQHFCLQVQLQLLFAHLNYGQIAEAQILALAFQDNAPERPEGWFYQAYTAYWLNQEIELTPLIQQARERGYPALECELLSARWEIHLGRLEMASQRLTTLPSGHYGVRLQWLRVFLSSGQNTQAFALWQDLDKTKFSPQRILHLPHWSPQERRELRKNLARFETDKLDHNSVS